MAAAQIRVPEGGLPGPPRRPVGCGSGGEEGGQSWRMALRGSASKVDENAPEQAWTREERAHGPGAKGPGKASWSQGKGLPVGAGEGAMLEAAEEARRWASPEGHRGSCSAPRGVWEWEASDRVD